MLCLYIFLLRSCSWMTFFAISLFTIMSIFVQLICFFEYFTRNVTLKFILLKIQFSNILRLFWFYRNVCIHQEAKTCIKHCQWHYSFLKHRLGGHYTLTWYMCVFIVHESGSSLMINAPKYQNRSMPDHYDTLQSSSWVPLWFSSKDMPAHLYYSSIHHWIPSQS